MKLHRPTGRALTGLALGLFTALVWGTLPVILKLVVEWLDVYTIAFARFLLAGLLTLPIALRSRSFGAFIGALRGRGLGAISRLLLFLSVLGLTGNYLTFMGGLTFISPGTAQVVVQLSPLCMLLAGLFIFGEHFSRLQWLGLAVLLAGFALFFHPRYEQLIDDFSTEGVGVLLIVLAAVLWGLYMVTQKQLLQDLRPEVILLCIYLGGSLLLSPWIKITDLLHLPLLGVVLLVASAMMTMVSYFTFAMALHHVEASRIGVLIALTPLIVFGAMELLLWLRPGILEPEYLPPMSLIGALLVVVGSGFGSLGRTNRSAR
ncbi:MAG: DMT family transporter [Candidatus Latescibacterota bacterium]|nr:DMT family transporter [Candidatus Latescibacterota bacterium]